MKSFLLMLVLSIISVTALNAYPGGVSGYTKKTNSSGCYCHTSTTTSTVLVAIQGPATLQPSQVGDYTVTVSGGAGTAVGTDIATSGGTLQTSDGNLKILTSELTHPSAKSFSNGQYIFNFKLTAPATAGKVTLYATACSKKSQWNFAPNFDVTVESPSSVNDETLNANSFQLNQNFPNPFNPKTTINYQIASSSFVNLKVFDILGTEVATLVNERKEAGHYEIDFNIEAVSTVPFHSGAYFYQIRAGNFIETKKMIFLK